MPTIIGAVVNDDGAITSDGDAILVSIEKPSWRGAPTAVLSGTLDHYPVNGIITWSDLSIDVPNTTPPDELFIFFMVSVPALTLDQSDPFNITATTVASVSLLTPLYPDTENVALLADPTSRYRKLKTDPERSDQIAIAELLLGLKEPVYTGRKASEIIYAIALQVNFQLDQGTITAQIMRSVSTNAPGNSMTTYRDRYLHPGAADIVNRATGRAVVGFTPMASGT